MKEQHAKSHKRSDTKDLAHTMFVHIYRGSAKVLCAACHKSSQKNTECLPTKDRQCMRLKVGKCDKCGKTLR